MSCNEWEDQEDLRRLNFPIDGAIFTNFSLTYPWEMFVCLFVCQFVVKSLRPYFGGCVKAMKLKFGQETHISVH
jgi:hypothetical protein